MYLYRIETRDTRLGPWNGPGNVARMEWRGHNPSNGPGWDAEPFRSKWTPKHVTFLQKKSLVNKWFKGRQRKLLAAQGYVLAKYRVVPKMRAGLHIGEMQAIAFRDKLEHIVDYIIY